MLYVFSNKEVKKFRLVFFLWNSSTLLCLLVSTVIDLYQNLTIWLTSYFIAFEMF